MPQTVYGQRTTQHVTVDWLPPLLLAPILPQTSLLMQLFFPFNTKHVFTIVRNLDGKRQELRYSEYRVQLYLCYWYEQPWSRVILEKLIVAYLLNNMTHVMLS